MLDTRIREALRSKGSSLSKACRDAGVNYKTLHSQLSHGREIPFPTIDRISKYSKLPLEYFSEFRPEAAIQSPAGSSELQRRVAHAMETAIREQSVEMMRSGYSIGTDDVLDWLRVNDGVLQNFDGIRQYVDLFHKVDYEDNALVPYQIGRDSLAARCLNVENEDHFSQVVNGFDKGLIEQVMADHVTASSRNYLLSDCQVKVTVAGNDLAVAYRRLIAPVRDLQGNEFSLVFARRTANSPQV